MDESSYSPSEESSEHIVQCSQVSLRTVDSLMSISSAETASKVTITSRRKHKAFRSASKRGHLLKMKARGKLKFPKLSETITSEISQPRDSTYTTSTSNIAINLGVIRHVLDSMAKCLICNGRLDLLESNTSSGCASFLSMKCSVCDSEKKFWASVSIPIVQFP